MIKGMSESAIVDTAKRAEEISDTPTHKKRKRSGKKKSTPKRKNSGKDSHGVDPQPQSQQKDVKQGSADLTSLSQDNGETTIPSRNVTWNMEGAADKCFYKVSMTMYLSIAPIFCQDPLKGIISQHLDPLIMTYFSPAGGVVLSHFDVRLHGKGSKIQYDSPFSFTWISVDLLVWRPQKGDIVDGWINLQSPGHIGLLIHNTFNASIRREAIPKDWRFIAAEADDLLDSDGSIEGDHGGLATTLVPEDEKEAEDNDVYANGLAPTLPSSISKRQDHHTGSIGWWYDGQAQRVEGKIKFKVLSLEVSGKVASVEGSLLGEGQDFRDDLTI